MASRTLIIWIFWAAFLALVSGMLCPEKYTRFTPQHSFCLDPNPQCNILKQGVNEADVKVILKQHNKYRNLIASGGMESPFGPLPTAANMMKMEWDSELAAIAQGWASQCVFERDCQDCRRVERFPVAQLVSSHQSSCLGEACVQPDWESNVKHRFYAGLAHFHKEISPFRFKKEYEDFSQISWGVTSKIGCGFAAYMDGNFAEKLYVCNYAPAGNTENGTMYVEGVPCSQCPTNTSCKGTFNGLCSAPEKQPHKNHCELVVTA